MRLHLVPIIFVVIAGVSGGSMPLVAQPAELVAAWSFDEGSGSTLQDRSGNGNDGTLSGASWSTQGKFGGALSFDGVNDWVTVSDSASLDLTTAMTVEAWVYPTVSQSGWRTIVQKQVDAYFLHASTHVGSLRPAGGGTVAGAAVFALAPASIPAATWTHLAITFDGSTFRLYVNGTQISSLSSAGSLETNANPLRIGGNSTYGEYFNGLVDEVRIYRRVLTAAEIQTDMSTPVGSPPSGTPPVLTITQPLDGQTLTNTTLVNVSYTAAGDLGDVDHVHFQLDSRPEVMDIDFDGSIQFTNVSAGPHVIRGYLVRGDHTEIAGSDDSVSFSTSVPDLAPPTITMTAPSDGSVVSGIITLAADATDDTGIAGVQFRLDGVAFGAEDRSLPYSLPLNTTTIVNGTHSISAVVRDLVGNSVESQPISVTVSNLNPNDPAVIGQWSGPYDWPFVAIHLTLLPTGEVLAWDDHTEIQGLYLWNPLTDTFFTFPQTAANIWCSGHTALPDGKILIAGGTGSSFNIGLRQTSLYDPQLRTFSNAAPMRYARYYPTVIGLADGRCLVVSGTDGCSSCVQEIPEIFDPGTGAWTELPAAGLDIPYYPHLFLLPDGRILACGTSEAAVPTRVLDLATQSWTVLDTDEASGGSAAMYLPGKILRCGRANSPGIDAAASATTQLLDTTVPSPGWRTTAPMAFPRTHHNLTLLPDGTVVVIGGGRNSNASAIDEAVHEAELWSPATETWSTMAAMQTPRLYHGTTLLLPDGRVLVAGSGRPTGLGGVEQFSAEIYSPPYLFRGPRPVINSSPEMVPHGSSFFLGTPDASRISKISLVRLGSVTHAFNQDQRYLPLTFQPATGGFTVQAPADPRVAPPGHYMLFLVDTLGVPSLSAMVRLPTAVEDLTPPSAPGNPSAVVDTGSVRLAWSAASDNVAVVKYHVHRSTTPGFAPSGANRIAETTSTAFIDNGIQATGTYYYRITAMDAAGNVGPPSSELAVSAVADTTPPSVPLNLLLLTISPNRIDLSWDASSDDLGVAGYTVFRDSVQIASVPTASFSDVTLSPSTTYTYAVSAFDSAGNSSQLSPPVSATTPQASSGLVAAYGFNEGNGTTATDASGNANTGTITAATWTTQGKLGGALSFNGSSSLVLINDSSSLDLSTAMTLEAWVFPAASQSGWRTVIQKEVDTYLLHAGSESALLPATGATYGGSVTWIPAPGNIPVGQWTHLAGTYDGARLRLYVNGVEVASIARTGAISVNNLPVRIGGNSPYGEYFNGRIDEVRIYNRALSATEIQSDMNTPIGSQPPSPAAPTGLTATPGNAQVTLNWNASAGATSYNVSRSLTSGGPYAGVAFNITGTTFADNTVNNGATYFYVVTAVNSSGESPYSNQASATPTAGNSPPVISSLTSSQDPVPVNTPVTFALSATDTNGDALTYSFNFGDGTPPTAYSSDNTTAHTYTAAGRYTVFGSVRDGANSPVITSLVQIVHRPLTAGKPTASAQIIYDSSRNKVWNVNPDSDTVTRIDATSLTREFETTVGTEPRTLALRPNNSEVWVTCESSDQIYILNAASGVVEQTLSTPRGSRPMGIAFSPDGAAAYVTYMDRGLVAKFDPATRAVLGTLDVGPSPRAIAISADSARIFVGRFISPVNPTNPSTEVGEVREVSASSFTVIRTLTLAHDNSPDTEVSGRGTPNYLIQMSITPDGQRLWVPSKKDNTDRGQFRDGFALGHDSTVRSIFSLLDLVNNVEDAAARRDMDDHELPHGVTFSPVGDLAFIAYQGNNEVWAFNAYNGGRVARISLGAQLAPQDLVLNPAGTRLFVLNFMTRSVSIFDVAGLVNGSSSTATQLAVINAVTTEKLSPQVLQGKRIFYNAADPRMSLQGYISCAVCHLDGGQDGRVWDFTDRQEGFRNTAKLQGKRGTGQGNVHWTANFDEIQDFELDIRNEFGGTGFISGTPNSSLGAPNAGRSADLDALAAFVASLSGVGRSPYRNADGTLTADGVAGRQLFQNLNCTSCHSGPEFTDSTRGTNGIMLHDVGTIKASSGKRLGQALTGLDTPTLKGAWNTAPYLHDGSAATLLDVITTQNPGDLHGATSTLTPTQLAQLVAYLRQIDDDEPGDTTAPTISDISNQTIDEDATTGALGFTVGDAETAAGSLTVTGNSDNTTLVPLSGIVFGGSGANRTVTVSPTANQTGTATITVTVSDGALTASDTFVLTVNAVNDGPTISNIPDQFTTVNTATAPIAFTVGDVETAAGSLTVSGASSNPTLVAQSGIMFGGSGANRTVTVSPAANQTGTATITVTVSDGALSASDTFVLTVNAGNTAPTISDLGNQTINEDTTSGPLSFTVGDAETAAGSLTVSGASSNPTLVPPSGIAFGGSGANRTVTVSPAANQSGTATITVNVSDGALTASDTFVVTVNAVNDGPTISDIADQSTTMNTATPAIAFTVGDVETAAGSLTVTGSSDNTTLVLPSGIVFGGSGTNRTVTVTPASNQNGSATITVTVSDGSLTASDAFVLTVNAAPSGLVAAYGFNEGSGTTATDASGNANTGTITAATWTTQGWSGGALSFNGSSSLVVINDSSSLDLTTAMTLEAWVFPAVSQSGWRTVIQKEVDTYLLHAGSVSPLVPAIGATYGGSVAWIPAPGSIPVGQWTHLAGTYDGARLRLYVNGVEVASIARIGAIDVNNLPVRIGGNSPYGEFFNGRIDEVRIYNRALSAVEIQTDMNTPVNAMPNTAPTISDIGNQTVDEDGGTGALAFTVGDAETAAGSLTVTGSSDNTTLLPNANIVFGGSGTSRTVTVSPAANQGGTATITVTVSDGQLSSSNTFVLTVNAVNDGPTISNIPDQFTTANTATAAIPFTVGDVETAAGSLTVSGASSNPTLVAQSGIAFGGSGANRTVTVSPAANQTGTATITITVSDGLLTASSSFLLTVSSSATGTLSFTNLAAITVPSQGAGTPYPSTINVAGMSGAISKVTVTLRNISHTNPDDVDALLVGPGGQKVLIVSDAGGSGDLNGVTLTLDDAANSSLSNSGQLSSGTFRPSNYDTSSDAFPAPAPAAPYATVLSTFNGQVANGDWRLFVRDDRSGSAGSFAGGWSLAVTTTAPVQAQIASVAIASPPKITSITIDRGAIQLMISGEVGFNYALEASPDLVHWAEVSVQVNETGTVVFRDEPTTNAIRFYRAVAMPE